MFSQCSLSRGDDTDVKNMVRAGKKSSEQKLLIPRGDDVFPIRQLNGSSKKQSQKRATTHRKLLLYGPVIESECWW
jgi:hypothetical protein